MPSLSHPVTTITNQAGSAVNASLPVIISASRATDIPAFHSEWFINRLRAGYCAKQNPYNAASLSYVSFARAQFCIFWTKNPRPLFRYLDDIDKRFSGYYFLFTLNDYEREKLEPGLPALDERIDTFIELSERIGRKRVIWRFDPILRTERTLYRDLLERAAYIGDKIHSHTEKMIISFAELQYRKVKRNCAVRSDLFIRPVEQYGASKEERLVFCNELQKIATQWKRENHLTIATCAERYDLSSSGIVNRPCIDAVLLNEISGVDPYPLITGADELFAEGRRSLKDPGQRKECLCALAKDIGRYDSCGHFCTYCYANSSETRVKEVLNETDPLREYL